MPTYADQNNNPRLIFDFFVCLIRYAQVNNFSVMSGPVFLGLTSTKQG